MEQSSQSESVVTFGQYSNLLGVFQPALDMRSAITTQDIAVLMLTPGMLHHIGPFRLHVQLARQLARAGMSSFRFDLSGIGESFAIGAPKPSLDRAKDEVRQAIDVLQERFGVQRVICFGLCSGADDAIYAALDEPRIVGVFALDGAGYRTRKYFWKRLQSKYLPKLLNPRKCWEAIKIRLGVELPAPDSLQLGADVREFPEQAVAECQLQSLAERGVQLHFHYTGGVDDYYNYAEQFGDMFPNLDQHPSMSHSFNPAMDHVAFLTEHRNELVELVVRTVQQFTLRIEPLSASETSSGDDHTDSGVETHCSADDKCTTTMPVAFPGLPVTGSNQGAQL